MKRAINFFLFMNMAFSTVFFQGGHTKAEKEVLRAENVSRTFFFPHRGKEFSQVERKLLRLAVDPHVFPLSWTNGCLDLAASHNPSPELPVPFKNGNCGGIARYFLCAVISVLWLCAMRDPANKTRLRRTCYGRRPIEAWTATEDCYARKPIQDWKMGT